MSSETFLSIEIVHATSKMPLSGIARVSSIRDRSNQNTVSIGAIHLHECNPIWGCDNQLIGQHLALRPFSQALKGGWAGHHRGQQMGENPVSGQTAIAIPVYELDH